MVHCRCDRMHLFRVDRLNLHASGGRVAASGLRAQGLQLRRRYRGAGMLLQHPLLRREGDRGRGRSEFGDYGTTGN